MQDEGHRPGHFRAFIRTFSFCAAVLILAGSALALLVDPFWIWWTEPPWLAWTGGRNRVLEVEMRRAKPLQLFARPASTVLIGDSMVQRGLRPADSATGPGRTFNLGLPALLAAELPTIARLVRARGSKRVVIGLDYFMFTDVLKPPRAVDPALTDWRARSVARIKAVISLRAIVGSLMIGRAYPGAWQYDGFKAMPDFPPAVTQRIARQQVFRRYRSETLHQLAEALAALRYRDVRLYLSPMNRYALGAARAEGRVEEITRYRADIAALA